MTYGPRTKKTLKFIAAAAICVALGWLVFSSGDNRVMFPHLPAKPDPSGVSVGVTPRFIEQRSGGTPLEGFITLEVLIANNTPSDIWLLAEPDMPYVEATTSTLTIRWHLIDDYGASGPYVFPIPASRILMAGDSTVRTLRLANPIRLRNKRGRYLSFPLSEATIDNLPEVLPEAPQVLMSGPLQVRAVIGFGVTTWRHPIDPQVSVMSEFFKWQQVKESVVRTIEDP